VTLAILMFRFGAPVAGVFELSICTGLITVLFVSTISITKAETGAEMAVTLKGRWKKYLLLPVILALAVLGLMAFRFPFDIFNISVPAKTDLSAFLWGQRTLDVIGQIAVLLAGVFGVVILFRENKNVK
jgi:NADH-quinone oxidoreductase subunit J